METKKLISILGFLTKENASDIYSKKYSDGTILEVDFEKKTFNFGGKIKIQGKDLQNITKPEDWVVLECVDRLLEKGYKAENISLEKVYPAGHGFSGRLDICLTRDDGSEYLLIECKTFGKEFDKELAKIKKNGGQLFTYFKFSNKADVILLYASELSGNKIVYRNEIVKIEDDYRTGDVKDFYEKWNKLTKDNGVFEEWVNPYNFESKALTIKDLEEIRQEDSSFIFNRFLEILRHNVVSDKGNAFNRIFTLFLCKIYDEKTNEGTTNELGFQWFEFPFTYDGIYYPKDDHKSFQIRLTDLYKNGMKAFLEKNVTDLSDTEFNSKFHYLTEEQRAPILAEFKKIRLEKNNEFAIKDVYDEQSFYDNAVVVKEIVELLQKFKIRYTKKQQYLSDFFELLLTTGLKQESGQFFTPVPIAQFIIKSLPLNTVIEDKLQKGIKDEYLPYVMDYAAGSGHFLTETMHEVQRILDTQDFKGVKADVNRFIEKAKTYHFDWAYDYIYGIEKDYRLVKVGKVGCYLHGDGLANVIHSDGLARFSHPDYKGKLVATDKDFPKENKQFDIIVSNPPYSVSAFRNNASKYYNAEEFELYEKLTDTSSEIECLFIERTKQLLKDGGVAGIILPSSILSNSGIYAKAREIILQYFDIVGITELGSNTFMATGTNTVTLFLRRRNNYDIEKIKSFITRFFNDYLDNTVRLNDQTSAIEKPITKYVNHVWENITLQDYITALKKEPNKNITEHELFKEYKKKLKAKNDTEFWKLFLEREAEKLLYFIIAYPQKTVLVKSGSKNAEKRFLGYEFSNRRGSEGIHPIQRGKNIEDCTLLFDADVFENPEKASTYIYKAFQGDFDFPIDKTLQKNITRHNLVDMFTFDRIDFENNISLSVKKKVKYEEIWGTEELKSLDEISEIKKGKSITQEKTVEGEIPVIAGGQEPAYFHNKSNREGNIITISASGAYAGFINYFETPIFASDCNTIQSKAEDKISTKLIFLFLKSIQDKIYELQRGQAQPHVYGEDLAQIKIPLPPKGIQDKIVKEIEVLEDMGRDVQTEISNYKNKITNIITSSQTKAQINNKLENLTTLITKGSSPTWQGISYVQKPGVLFITSENVREGYIDLSKRKYLDNKFNDIQKRSILEKGDVLINIVGASIGRAGIFDFEEIANINQAVAIIRCLKNKLNPYYLNHILNTEESIIEYSKMKKEVARANLSLQNISDIKIFVPPLAEQQKIVSEIETIETKIKKMEEELQNIPKLKEAVLKKYL